MTTARCILIPKENIAKRQGEEIANDLRSGCVTHFETKMKLRVRFACTFPIVQLEAAVKAQISLVNQFLDTIQVNPAKQL